MSAAPGGAARRGAGAAALLTRLSGWMPLIILAYAAIAVLLRASFSDFLEVDEADFVGQLDFRLLYENSHPPLYNWALRITLELTGWDWPLSVALVKFALLGAYHWASWDTGARLGGPLAGVLAVAASAAAPQIVWMSVFTLAHSVMVLAAAALTVNALIRALEAPSLRRWAWVGLAATLGALGKWNFFLFLLPLAAAIAWDPRLRRAIGGAHPDPAHPDPAHHDPANQSPASDDPVDASSAETAASAARAGRQLAWLAAPLIVVAATAPIAGALALQFAENAARLGRLYSGGGRFSAIDLPVLGIDGLFELGAAILAWAGALWLLWGLARWREGADAPGPAPTPGFGLSPDLRDALVRAIGRAMAAALVISALMVFFGDVHRVDERYLTPMLAALPVWLALQRPLGTTAPLFAGVAAAAYAAALIGYWGVAAYGPHRFSYPYGPIAALVARQAGADAPLPILSTRRDDPANLTLALGWPGAASPTYTPLEDKAVLVWRGRGDAPSGAVPRGFGPASEILTVNAPYTNARTDSVVFRVQLFERRSGF